MLRVYFRYQLILIHGCYRYTNYAVPYSGRNQGNGGDIFSKTKCSNANLLWASDIIWRYIGVSIGSGNGFLPDGIMSLLEAILTYQWDL